MKILIVINNLGVGGAERLVIDDINEMLERGIDLTLMTFKPERGERTLASQCRISKEKWIKVNFESLLNIMSFFKVLKQVKKIKPDVIISHLWHSNTIFKFVSIILGIKLIIFEHNVYDTLKTKKMFLIDKLTQKIPSEIVAVSSAVKDSLLRHGIKGEKIKVILNGIDVSEYQKPLDGNTKEKIQKEFNIQNSFTFIFIGKLIYQKGVDILIKAFKNIDAKLLLIGDGANKEEFQSLVRELDIEDKVIFAGTRQDIPDLLRVSDCFVLPSRYEGLPMVLLEAIAARKAIIVSDFDSAKELINGGLDGIIVPKENIDALSSALHKISQDLPFRQSLESEISKIDDRVSIKNHIDQLLHLV